jgi:hypothetical protein
LVSVVFAPKSAAPDNYIFAKCPIRNKLNYLP